MEIPNPHNNTNSTNSNTNPHYSYHRSGHVTKFYLLARWSLRHGFLGWSSIENKKIQETGLLSLTLDVNSSERHQVPAVMSSFSSTTIDF